jgi:uncharacterized protein YbdZ (MbtH family)
MNLDGPKVDPRDLRVVPSSAPQTIRAPIDWRVTHLLQDGSGTRYAMAAALDPVRNEPLQVLTKSGSTRPLLRLFVPTPAGWEPVTDKDLQVVCLAMVDSARSAENPGL